MTFASRVYTLIEGTESGHADLLTPLAAIVASGTDPTKAPADKIKQLVDALLEGDANDQLSHEVRTQVHIDTYIGVEKGWKYGTVGLRFDLRKHLWATAVALKDVDPKGAARFARAAVLFAAYDEIPLGREPIVGILQQKEPSFVSLAGPIHSQDQAVEQFINEQNAIENANSKFFKEVGGLIDAWIDSKAPALAPEQRDEIIAKYRAWWDSCAADEAPMMTWNIAYNAWRFLNVARSHNDQHTVDAIKGLLAQWQNRLRDPDERRWMQEAASLVGPPVDHMLPTRTMRARLIK